MQILNTLYQIILLVWPRIWVIMFPYLKKIWAKGYVDLAKILHPDPKDDQPHLVNIIIGQLIITQAKQVYHKSP